MPVVSVSSASAAERGTLNFTITLDEAAFDAVTLDYQMLMGTGEEIDLARGLSSGEVTFAPGEVSKTLEIGTRYSDREDERDESMVLRLSGLSDNARFAGGEDHLTATGVILDDDGVGSNLALFVSDVELVEGDSGSKQAVFELRLSQPSSESFSVSYRTRDISATAGSDYAETLGSATFAVGDVLKTVRVPVYGDTSAEITESFALVVTAPNSPALAIEGLAGEAVIRDDDSATPTVSVSPARANERSSLLFDVTLSAAAFDAVTLDYQMLMGTGEEIDLARGLSSGELTFAPGEVRKTLEIGTRYSDSEDERDESMVLRLSGLSDNAGFAGGEDHLTAAGMILDDDGVGSNLALFVSDVELVEGDSGSKEAVFELRLSQPASEAFSVTYRTRDISAVAGEDYTARSGSVSFTVGEEVKVVRVPLTGDTEAEMTESFALVVDAPDSPDLAIEGLAGEAVIRDDDSATPTVSVSSARANERSALLFEVTLSEASLESVTLDYQMLMGTGEEIDLSSGLSSGEVTFAPGEVSKTIAIGTRYSDSEDERDESMVLRLSGLSNSAGFAGGEDHLTVTGVILDDDGVGSNLALLVSDVELVEGDSGSKEAVFELRLSRPATEAMQVSYATRDITARAGEDYAARSGNVSFAVGEEVKVVRVPVYGDTASEFTERFALRVDTSSVAVLGVTALEAEAMIRDDDTATPTVSVSNAQANERSALLFEVTLSEASLQSVTMDYQMLSGTAEEIDLARGLSSGEVTFAPGEVSKTIEIGTRYSDSEDERDETVFLELSNAVNAGFADGAPSVQAVGMILDDDGAGLNRIASVAPMILREHGVASFVYEIPVELSEPAGETLNFTVSAIDQTAIEGIDYRLLDSTVRFATGQSVAAVSVEVLGDSQVESTEAFALSLDPVSGTPYSGSVPDQTIYIRPGPLLPSPEDDVLEGTVGNDNINLLAGNDFYEGLEGDDTVLGGAGDDTVLGGAGADEMDGMAGNDLLIGGAVEDVSSETGAQVYRLYQATLGRVPDTAGFDSWEAQLEGREVTLFEVIAGFTRSAEFQQTYGTLGNTGFVNQLYRNVLGREADAAGLQSWVAQLDSGTSREQVVRGLSQSAEFMELTNPAAYAYVSGGTAAPYADDVFRFYQATLDRAPDFAGLQSWAERLGEGTEVLSVIGGFVNSQEFQNTYGAVNNAGFVTLLYQNVLGRAPDANGLSGWTAQLNAGTSRETVVQGFAQSAELVRNTDPAFKAFMAGNEGDRFDGGPGNDLLYGGLLADEFVFDTADPGADRVLQLDAWDSVSFEGFGYANAAEAISHMRETASDVIFADKGVSVTFMRADLALFDEVSVLV